MSTHRLSVGSSGSPTPRPHVDKSLSWTDDLPVCHLSGVGFATNQIYREDGFRREEHEFEDKSIHFRCEGGLHLYGVFDGHDGTKVSHFAAQRMPAELLLGQLCDKTDDVQIKDIITQAFISVEKGFFDSIDDALAQKANLMLHVPEGIKPYELFNKYPELFKRLEMVESEIAGGSTAVVALIKDSQLYVANVGCSRALLCTRDMEGILRVVQLSSDHNLQNEEELDRLAELGVEVDKLLEFGKLGESIYTRSIGDHDIKARIRELDHFKDARSEPVIAEPYVTGGIPIHDVQGFLILMSYGLFKGLLDATGTEHVNIDIAGMVASEFASQSTLNGVAQAVVDKVVRLHHDAFMTSSEPRKELCQKRKDITLLVRNFNYPLPNAVSSPTSCSQINPLTAFASQGVDGGHDLSLSEPLSVLIPPDKTPPPAPASLTIYLRDLTHTNSHTATNQNTTRTNLTTTYSSNDSTQSGEDSTRLFQKTRDTGQLDLDAEGRIASYVDFSDFYKAIEEMTEAQRESFNSTSEPKPAYETIPEEPGTPQSESLPVLNGPDVVDGGPVVDGEAEC